MKPPPCSYHREFKDYPATARFKLSWAVPEVRAALRYFASHDVPVPPPYLFKKLLSDGIGYKVLEYALDYISKNPEVSK